MDFVFHAAPPPGEWTNDPNGLVFADGMYRLFLQHSSAAPDFKAIGWARLSSDDLLHWVWDGPVIPPDASGLAYSGSVLRQGEALTAYLTRHAPPFQQQYRLTSTDAGASWHQELAPLGPHGRNIRDPFVFDWAATGDRLMLLAEPCDWTDWPTQPPSSLSIWREAGGRWQRTGTIGPWSPAGMMWEVPVLLDIDGAALLLVSVVDRRGDRADCSVRYWAGQFNGSQFIADDPAEGMLLDHGPDFYATCVNTVAGWPDDQRTLVGWASSWATARKMPWPGNRQGGPISLPRRLSMVDGRLHQYPWPKAMALASRHHWQKGDTLDLVITGDEARFGITVDRDGNMHATRSGSVSAIAWDSVQPGFLLRSSDIAIFVDQGLIEIFFETEGKTMTIFVPGAQPLKG